MVDQDLKKKKNHFLLLILGKDVIYEPEFGERRSNETEKDEVSNTVDSFHFHGSPFAYDVWGWIKSKAYG